MKRMPLISRFAISTFYRACLCIFLVLVGGAPWGLAATEKRSTNVLVIIADDLGWRDVGYHGSEIRTPHIDKLAAAGVRLERHYVYPTCSPTRAGLLTGRNPSRFGILAPIAGRSEQILPAKTATLASVLKEHGYATALSGKWHLGLRPEAGPRRYGFDQTYGYLHGQIDQWTHRYKNGDKTWHRNDRFLDETGHATDLIASEAIRFLETARTEPFFLYVAFSVPHHPVQEEERWITPYASSIIDASRRLYAASVTHMDSAIGRILDTLETRGQISQTLILFTSDNGGQQSYSSRTDYEGRHGPNPTLGNNRPLRGWKGELYEGGIRVPAVVHWQGRLKPKVLNSAVNCLDWFPTVAQLAGVKLSSDWKIEGRDVWPLLSGEGSPSPDRPLYWNIGGFTAVIQDGWKLIVHQQGQADIELYDLEKDAAEETNRASVNPRKTAELKRVLATQRRRDP